MSSKRRNRALKRRQKLSLDSLAPKIAAGITQGASAKEALDEFPVQASVDGVQLVQDHLGGEQKKIDRLPVWRAVVVDDTQSVWVDEPTGRLQRNAIEKVDVETFRALQSGHMCLRCKEPHPEAFPEVCDFPGCYYPMRERQVLDIAMEFRGHDHIGPSQPMTEYLEQQTERLEREEHALRKSEGGSPQTAVSRKILSPGAKRLRGLTGRVKVDDALIEKATEVKVDAP